VRNYMLGAFCAIMLIAVAACGGQGSPGTPYPSLSNVGGSTLSTSGTSITLPQATGLAVGTAKISGSGSVSLTQSIGNPSNVPVLMTVGRPAVGPSGKPQSSASPSANTALAYVTVTASATSSISNIQLTLSPTAGIPNGTYYLAYWNGAQWVTIGSAATVSGTTITVNSGSINPAVSLAAGSSYYLAIYTGQIFVTPTPEPSPPVASPSSLSLSLGQIGTITVTSNPQITITATSSNASVATVTASASTGSGTTATFTVTTVGVGNATLTFKDPINQTTTVAVEVNNNSPTPEPSPQTATIGLGDVVAVLVNADPNTLITVTSGSGSIAGVSATNASSTSATASATTNGSGQVTFYVTGNTGGATTIAFSDPSTPPNVGTMNVTVSAITNGAFTNGTTGWVPCSYTYADTDKSTPTNAASPFPNTPEPAQTAASETPVPLASLSPLVAVTAPPANDNPGWSDYTSGSLTPNTGSVSFSQNGISETITTPSTAPPVLGSSVMLLGSINASPNPYPKGTFGVCQSFTVPTPEPNVGDPYISLWVLEGGTEYTFKYADNEAAIFGSYSSNVASTLDEYLFAEENCYAHPSTATPAGIWGGSGITGGGAGCWPADYGGDPSLYQNWLEGGFWSPRGPYDLSAYAGQTVTLFLGNWSYYHDTATYYLQFMYVGNVQTTFGSTFPSSAPLAKGRMLGTVSLGHRRGIQAATPRPH